MRSNRAGNLCAFSAQTVPHSKLPCRWSPKIRLRLRTHPDYGVELFLREHWRCAATVPETFAPSARKPCHTQSYLVVGRQKSVFDCARIRIMALNYFFESIGDAQQPCRKPLRLQRANRATLKVTLSLVAKNPSSIAHASGLWR